MARTLCVCGAALTSLTVAAAWSIQTFFPYYSWGVGDFYAWVGRVLWAAIALTLFALALAWKDSPVRLNILRAILMAVILLVGLNLELELQTKAEGRYYFSTNWVSKSADNWQEVLRPFAGKPGVKALEIGSYEGRSAIWFLENILTDRTSSITCIDVFMGAAYESNFDHNVKPFGAKVIKIKAPSYQGLRGLKLESYDFAYIDGSHFAPDVLLDAALTWDLIKPGGVIIFDDYGEDYTGPKSEGNYPRVAIDAFLKIMDRNVDVLFKGYQIAVRKRATLKPAP